MATTTDKAMTRDEVAARLGCSVKLVQALIDGGELRAIDLHHNPQLARYRRLRVLPRDFEAFIQRRALGPAVDVRPQRRAKTGRDVERFF